MELAFRADLCTRVCPEIEVPLSGATVRLYRAETDNVAIAATARPKETFQILSEDRVNAKADRLLAEADVDEDGLVEVTIDEEEAEYGGEAVEIDIRLSDVPEGTPFVAGEEESEGPFEAVEEVTEGTPLESDEEVSEGTPLEPVQASITTHQPEWRKHEQGAVATWEHCLATQEWCAILEEFGLWVVAGRITDCETEEPLEDMEVTVFDADIIQHDALGSDTTNANGEYVIYYTDPDVKRVPFGFTPVELTNGPDLYFNIESSGGTVLLDEDTSDGRQPGRENVERCHCEDLCVDFTPEDDDGDPPLFTHVGRFNIFQDLQANGTLNKARHNLAGEGWGFFRSIPLEGYVPEKHPDTGEQMWYRFLYRDSNKNEHPLVGNLVDRVSVGGKMVPTGSGPLGVGWQEYYVVGSAPTPNPSLNPQPVYLEPESGNSSSLHNGWVRVPDLTGSGLGHGPLMRFETRNAPTIPGGSPSTPTPGNSATTPTGEKIEIIFETTTTPSGGGPPTPSSSSGINRQNEIATLKMNNYGEVRTLDVVDQNDNPIGCDVADGVKVRYTADHEFLNSYSVRLKSQAAGGGGSGSTWPNTLASEDIDRATNPPATATGNAEEIDLPAVYDGGPSSPGDDYDPFEDWPSCSYIARLSTQRALTNGERPDYGDTTGAVNGVFYKG